MIHKLKYVIVKHHSHDHHDKEHEAGEGKDFTYPTTSSEATGLYQYIDNHIKNFDLSWQNLD